jgi:hypothetical protein
MPVVPIQVRHQNRTAEVIALIDSGADATILPINILQLIRARRGDTGHMRGVTGVRKRVGISFSTAPLASQKFACSLQ